MKEADIMINELMIANETMKLDMERLKETEVTLTNEKEMLINEVQSLQSINDLKDQQLEDLEEQFGSNLMETRGLVVELEGIIAQVQTSFKEKFMSMVCDFHCMKALVLDSGKLVRSWLEDVWSEIIVKDSAVSVLHLCHMGILLETVTGLNAENGLLQHGLCESNSVITDLREHNSKSSRELQMCRTLKGKLLADIKNSFDRISRKEEETGELGLKLTTFEKKIFDLQFQEELMLQRSNYMGSQLAILMKELDSSNTNVIESLFYQEKKLKDKEELLNSQAELLMMDLCSKDFESFILASQIEEMAFQKIVAEREQISWVSILENLKKEIIFSRVEAELNEQVLVTKEAEVTLLHKEAEEAQKEREDLLSMLNQCNLKIRQMDEVKKTFEEDIQLLKGVAHSNDTLRGELAEVMEANVRLGNQIKALDIKCGKLLEDLKMNEEALEEMGCQKAVAERERASSCAVHEHLKKEMILVMVDREIKEQVLMANEAEVALLQKEVKEARSYTRDLLSRLNLSNLRVTEIDEVSRAREGEIQQLKDVACSIDKLKDELGEVMETKVRLLSQLQAFEAEFEKLQKDLKTKETALENSSNYISVLDQQNQNLQEDICLLETSLSKLQSQLDLKDAELRKMSCLEEENNSLKSEVWKLKTENSLVLQDLEKKNSEVESSLSRVNISDAENLRLQDRNFSLETVISSLLTDLEMKNAEVNELLHSQSAVMADLGSKGHDLQIFVSRLDTLKEENISLRNELRSHKEDIHEALTVSSSNTVKCIDSVENVHSMGDKLFSVLKKESFVVVDKMFNEISESIERTSEFIKEIEYVECHAEELVSNNIGLHAELLRKDDILKGLLFDLSLLQESASNTKDQKDKIEEIMASLEALEDELVVKSEELDESVAHDHMLEAQLQEKMDIISTLKLDFAKEHESLKMCSYENMELKAQIEEALAAKCSLEEELTERRNLTESLEMELSQMGDALGQMNNTIEYLRSNRNELTSERDQLHMEMDSLKEKLGKAQAWAEENEAFALEAQQVHSNFKHIWRNSTYYYHLFHVT